LLQVVLAEHQHVVEAVARATAASTADLRVNHVAPLPSSL
jgi:hypothetical protein